MGAWEPHRNLVYISSKYMQRVKFIQHLVVVYKAPGTCLIKSIERNMLVLVFQARWYTAKTLPPDAATNIGATASG